MLIGVLYSLQRRKVLRRAVIKLEDLIKTHLEREDLFQPFRIQEFHYLPLCKILLLLVEEHENKRPYLVTIEEIFGIPRVVKTLFFGQNQKSVSIKNMNVARDQRIILAIFADLSHKLGESEDDELVLIDPRTLEIQHKLSGLFLTELDSQKFPTRSWNLVSLNNGNSLLLNQETKICLIAIGEDGSPTMSSTKSHSLKFHRNACKTVNVGEILAWNDQDICWLAKIENKTKMSFF